MTCELFDEPCEYCIEDYCPDQIETIQLTYRIMVLKLSALQKELDTHKVAMDDYFKEYEIVLNE